MANRRGVAGLEVFPVESCDVRGIWILGGSSLACFPPPVRLLMLLNELADPFFLTVLPATGPNAGDDGAVGGGVAGVTSRKKRARIWWGRSWASALYSSRSCSPVSPTSINLDSGKLSRTSMTFPRLRSAADSPHKPIAQNAINFYVN